MNDRSGAGDSVRCHSGYTYAQRPVSFTYQCKEHQVEQVIAENRVPEGKQFLVTDESGEVFELRYNEPDDTWQVRPSA